MYFSPGFLNSIRETDARPSSASGRATNPSGNAADATALVFLRDADVDGSAVVDHRTMESLSPPASSTSSLAVVIGFGWMNEGMRAILCACSFLPSCPPLFTTSAMTGACERTKRTNVDRTSESGRRQTRNRLRKSVGNQSRDALATDVWVFSL
jgi:hypothetical protein